MWKIRSILKVWLLSVKFKTTYCNLLRLKKQPATSLNSNVFEHPPNIMENKRKHQCTQIMSNKGKNLSKANRHDS